MVNKKCYYNHFAPVIKESLALKKIKGKRKQEHIANDSFTVTSKAKKTMDNFPLKKPNEQTNYKFEQKKTNSGPVLAKKKWILRNITFTLVRRSSR